MNTFLKYSTLTGSLFLAACSGGSSNSNGFGEISIGLTDAPVEGATAVVVTVTDVELKGNERQRFELSEPAEINLLDYQGATRVMLLEDTVIPAGDYQWIRLYIDEDASYIKFGENVGDAQYPLEIPSSAQTGLKLNRPFTVGAGSTTDFTIDFDVKKSVHQEGTGDYKLRPTLRIVDNLEAGTISGTVVDALREDVACEHNGDNNDIGNVVYVFEGADATLQDLQGAESGGDALTTALVKKDETTQVFEYEVGYVPVGEYTVAFTCDGTEDDPLEDNSSDVTFSSFGNVTVIEGETSTYNFE